MITRPLSVMVSLILTLGCAEPPPAEEPLPAEGLPVAIEGLLFGSSDTCREDTDCRSGACLYGMCAGLLSVDEPWRSESIAKRVDERVARPELRARVSKVLYDAMQRQELGLNSRARAARALGVLNWSGHREVLAEMLAKAPSELAEVIALVLMASSPPREAFAIVVEASRSKDTSRMVEALRALGSSKSPEALVPLLECLSTDLDLEVQRAAVAGLIDLSDKRAIRPLIRHLAVGPEPLADEIARGLRLMSGERFGPTALEWDAWVERSAPPTAPTYEPRSHRSEDDLDLPTP